MGKLLSALISAQKYPWWQKLRDEVNYFATIRLVAELPPP
jgi:hypothetical protein